MKNSFSMLLGVSLLTLTLASCNQPAPTMDAAQMQVKVDSIVASKTDALNAQADSMCKQSFDENVKMKCDSICMAGGMKM